MSLSMPSAFQQFHPKVEAELKSILSEHSLPLYAMMRYHLGWEDEYGSKVKMSGAKMVRPVLCLLANRAVGGDWQTIIPAATAIELIHNFTLIHDDIEDRSSERRHRQAIWKIWGSPHGINAGDAMHALAQLSLLKLEEKGIARDKIIQASKLLARACLELCEGQYLDIEYENRFNINRDDYLKMIDKKTARLFEISLHLGALLGTDEPNSIIQVSSFGRNLGLAYQIKNDLEGVSADNSAYDDIKAKKKTLPIIYALNEAKEGEKLFRIYQKAEISAEDITQVLQILNGSPALNRTREMIKYYYLQAKEAIEKSALPDSGKQELIEIASFLLSYS
jgi:geranylgeranyl diphosphate synthase type I